jgi:uncharacterized protein (DUF697 family)
MKKQLLDFAGKTLKKTIMNEPDNKDRSAHADTIIRNHVIWSMGAGLIPILVADIFAVSALQLDMIRQMCRVYGVDFSETQGKAIVTSLTSSTLARITAGSIIKLIPGVGSLLGGVTVSAFAGASTYALGEVFKKHFETGGTILDFDPDRLSKLYKEKFEKGKKVAEQLHKEQKEKRSKGEEDLPEGNAKVRAPKPQQVAEEDIVPSEPVAEKRSTKPTAEPTEPKTNGKEILEELKKLAELRDNGIISEEEFSVMKKKFIDML